MRVAFLGPAGTFTEEALRASAPGGVEEVAYPTVYETVMAVQTREADHAVVPIENSLEGSVTATLDTLALEAPEVRITGEVVHRIRHCLVARPGVEVEDVQRVVSHPQATAQCATFLRRRLQGAERASASSTAEAVRVVAEAGQPWAAIGSRLSAHLYGCRLLADGIEDRPDNATRFVWLSRYEQESGPGALPGGARKTSVVFWGFNDSSPGALVRVLGVFAKRGINLTKIESRPRGGLGRYMFFADLDGAEHEPRVRQALEELAERVETLRVLGSYPAG